MDRARQDLSGNMFGFFGILFDANRRGFLCDFEAFWVVFDHFGGQGGGPDNFRSVECIELIKIYLESGLVTL